MPLLGFLAVMETTPGLRIHISQVAATLFLAVTRYNPFYTLIRRSA